MNNHYFQWIIYIGGFERTLYTLHKTIDKSYNLY